MAFQPENDDLAALESKEISRNRIPVGFTLLFWSLIGWGGWYLWTYTPGLGGWQQSQDLDGGGASLASNLLATVAFTAIPTGVAIVLALGQRRKKATP